jgi:hypothetical protein
MGFVGSADIFQAQIMDLMASLEFVRAYMDDMLIIMRQRQILDEHLQKMETVLTRLLDAGLKVNAAKSSFCAHEIEYLGYILTREGIKPQPKKVQAILALNPPNNIKELRHFLHMVQYYRDMWARRSEMLAPRTDLVGKCGETKTTRMNNTKKKPWRWDPIHQQAFDNVKAAIMLELYLKGTAHGYFVLHAVCSACRFGVNGNFNLFFWVNGNFILFFLGEREFWKKINSMWFLSLQK